MSLTTKILVLVIRNDWVYHGDVMGIGEELRRCRHGEIDCPCSKVRFQEVDGCSGCSQSGGRIDHSRSRIDYTRDAE